jgi:hypothetical protein
MFPNEYYNTLASILDDIGSRNKLSEYYPVEITQLSIWKKMEELFHNAVTMIKLIKVAESGRFFYPLILVYQEEESFTSNHSKFQRKRLTTEMIFLAKIITLHNLKATVDYFSKKRNNISDLTISEHQIYKESGFYLGISWC